MKLRIRFNKFNIFLYLLIIPFMAPRGFSEFFSSYKNIINVWLLLAVVIIILYFLYRVLRLGKSYKTYVWSMVAYFFVFIVITFITQGGVTEGFQKLFVAPALCLFCAMVLDNKADNFIVVLSNILSINFFLNISVFNPMFWPNYFGADRKLLFLGHVQTVAQLGILGMFLAYLLSVMKNKRKSYILMFLSASTLLISETASSYIVLVGVLVGYFFYQIKKCKSVIDIKFIYGGYLFLNIALFWLSERFRTGWIADVMNTIGSGRPIIWNEALALIREKLFIGYGAYGVLIKVFWHEWSSNTDGMNAAHNEILQRLLDGGVVLLLFFLIMIYLYLVQIRRITNVKHRYYVLLFVIIMLTIMMFDSITEYYYIYFFIALIGCLPKFFEDK